MYSIYLAWSHHSILIFIYTTFLEKLCKCMKKFQGTTLMILYVDFLNQFVVQSSYFMLIIFVSNSGLRWRNSINYVPSSSLSCTVYRFVCSIRLLTIFFLSISSLVSLNNYRNFCKIAVGGVAYLLLYNIQNLGEK